MISSTILSYFSKFAIQIIDSLIEIAVFSIALTIEIALPNWDSIVLTLTPKNEEITNGCYPSKAFNSF